MGSFKGDILTLFGLYQFLILLEESLTLSGITCGHVHVHTRDTVTWTVLAGSCPSEQRSSL